MPDPQPESPLTPITASTFIIDTFTSTLSTWQTPQAANPADLDKYLPNYEDHLVKAKGHARTWIDDVRPQIGGLLLDLQGYIDLAQSTQNKVLIQASMRTLADARASDAQKAAAKADLNEIFDDLAKRARDLEISSESVSGTVSNLTFMLEEDFKSLQSDYDTVTDLDDHIVVLRADRDRKQEEIDSARSDLIGNSVGLVLGVLVGVVGAVAVVIAVAAAETVTLGLATPVAVLGLTAVGVGLGTAIGTAPNIKSASDRFNALCDEKDELNGEIRGIDSALDSAEALRENFASFNGALPDFTFAARSLRNELGKLPTQTDQLRRDALEVKSAADFDSADAAYTNFRAELNTLGGVVGAVIGLINGVTVVQVEESPRFSVKEKAA